MQLESIEHLVLECKGLNPTPSEGESDLAGALDEEGLMDLTSVTRTKQRLED